ncbi:MAG: FKBP-type peptidyl-prolyl cis-trans isomerase [Bacteroidales bacterium]|nr:FKBP-type peptidyl-prolyl cis-trans isomerase [Bacteroidales bacterium]
MKIRIFYLLFLACITLFTISCNKDSNTDFLTTDLGYSFKHCTINQNTPKAKKGDILYGEMEIRKNDSIVVYSNFGKPERLFQIISNEKGSVDEFLLNLHIGDSAIIIIPSDSISKYVPSILSSGNDKMYIYLKVQQIISKREMDETKNELLEIEKQEFDTIDYYIVTHSLNSKKQESGLYFININEGKGVKADFGDEVKVNYSVSTLDGKIIDTNILPIAKKAKIHSDSRKYEPFTFFLGDDGVIAGWTEGISLMKQGGSAKFIIPSKLAYGSKAFGPIKANTTLIFEVTLIEVIKK